MKKTILVSILMITVLISGCIQDEAEGTYDAYYGGYELLFNSNLDVAKDVAVIPDDATLKETLFGYNVVRLQFAYYDNDTEAPYYIKSLMSFASKYNKMSIARWDYDLSGKTSYIIINDTHETLNATYKEPILLLLGPAYSDETYVSVDDYIVTVHAADLELKEGKYAAYTDFDLALDRIILALMEE